MKAPKVGSRSEWRRTFAADEIRAFAELSGDKGRHHLEADEKGRLMAHGLLTATLPTKLGGDMHYIARTMLFEFLRPVYADEELVCKGKVETVKPEPRRWVVDLSFAVTNPKGKVVMKGKTSGVIRKPVPAPKPKKSSAETKLDALEALIETVPTVAVLPANRDSFMSRAPQARAALVSELTAIVTRASLRPDEAEVLLHVLAYAGYAEDGRLHLPSYSVLWGEAVSYVPAVRLPPERVAAAVRLLQRRGVLRAADPHASGVVLDESVLRGLA